MAGHCFRVARLLPVIWGLGTFAAAASDLPVKAPVIKAPAAVAPSWTGFYIGANIGGGWGHRDFGNVPNDVGANALFNGPVPLPVSTSFKSSGVIGGLQLGYNWQAIRNWLFGLETEFDWSGTKGSASSTGLSALPFTASVDERIKWFGTVRARLGYLPVDNLLAYVTGGFAFGKVEHTGNLVSNFGVNVTVLGSPGFTCLANATCFTGSSTGIATGWTAGGGLEYAVGPEWTLKAEYLYVSLDSNSFTESPLVISGGVTPATFNVNFNRTTFNIARVGLNYRF